MQPSKKILCLIIPTYNESPNVQELIDRIEKVVPELPFDFKLIFVDDNSTDGTSEIIKQNMRHFSNIKLIQRPKPTGLGSAYLDGFSYALTRFNADFVGEMDADLQHPPETLVEMSNKALEGNVQVILGSRYIQGGGAKEWSLGRRIISKGANLLSRVFIRVPVADSTTGLRLISSSLARGLLDRDVSAKGYAFQVESLYVYKKLGATFAEVPYFFGARKAGKTKLGVKEIFRFAWITMRTGVVGVKKKRLSPSPAAIPAPNQNIISE